MPEYHWVNFRRTLEKQPDTWLIDQVNTASMIRDELPEIAEDEIMVNWVGLMVVILAERNVVQVAGEWRWLSFPDRTTSDNSPYQGQNHVDDEK